MTKLNCEGELFKAWPEQEIFDGLMLQYELKDIVDIINIPFRIIEWCACESYDETWNEKTTEIDIIMTGNIIFEGIRHCHFAPQDDGYMNYPNIKSLSECLDRLEKLCAQYCLD